MGKLVKIDSNAGYLCSRCGKKRPLDINWYEDDATQRRVCGVCAGDTQGPVQQQEGEQIGGRRRR